MIEGFYDQWYAIWAPAIGEGECKHAHYMLYQMTS